MSSSQPHIMMVGKDQPNGTVLADDDPYRPRIMSGSSFIVRNGDRYYANYHAALSRHETNKSVTFTGTNLHNVKFRYTYEAIYDDNENITLTKIDSGHDSDRTYEPSRKKRERKEKLRQKRMEGPKQKSGSCTIL